MGNSSYLKWFYLKGDSDIGKVTVLFSQPKRWAKQFSVLCGSNQCIINGTLGKNKHYKAFLQALFYRKEMCYQSCDTDSGVRGNRDGWSTALFSSWKENWLLPWKNLTLIYCYETAAIEWFNRTAAYVVPNHKWKRKTPNLMTSYMLQLNIECQIVV